MSALVSSQTGVEVRTIMEDEIGDWCRAVSIGFLRPATDDRPWHGRPFDVTRTRAGVDGKRIVGTLRSCPIELTLPGGGQLTMAGLTNVTVLPTHRRRGLLKRMLDPDLRESRDRGEPIAGLIASEYPIYGRFGYGPATEHVTWRVSTAQARFTRPGRGTIRMVEPEEFARVAPALYNRMRAARVGEIDRHDGWAAVAAGLLEGREGFWKGFLALAEDPRTGEPIGALRYHTDGRFDQRVPDVTVEVDDLFGVDDDVEIALWRYCCEMDWVSHVQAQNRSPDDIVSLVLADGRAARQILRADFMWLRPLDVPAALAARRYATVDRFELEVLDPTGLSGGRFELEGGPDGAACRPTTLTPDVTVGIDALGRLLLGGGSFANLARIALVEAANESLTRRADAFFRWAATPFCSTWF